MQKDMRYRAVVFDLDGTIVDTIADVTQSINRALTACGYPKRTKKQVQSYVGNGIKKLVSRALPNGESSLQQERVYQLFMDDYAFHYADSSQPYPGICETLTFLKEQGIKLAVLSNKADEMTQPLIQKLFPNVFSCVMGNQPAFPHKPDSASYFHVMQKLGVTPQQTCYVGDSEVDLQTAQNAKTDVVSVAWGFRTKRQLKEAGAKTIVTTAEELRDYFCKK